MWKITIELTPFVNNVHFNSVLGFLLILCFGLVVMFSPAEHINKPLSKSDYYRLKTISTVLVICTCLIIILLNVNGKKTGILSVNLIEIVISMIIGKEACRYAKRKKCQICSNDC